MNTPKDQAEKEMQELVERGLPDPSAGTHFYDKEDLTAYHILYEALKEKPSVELSYDLSDKLVANLQARKDRIIDFRWNFILPLSLLFFLMGCHFAVLYFNSAYAEELVKLFLRFKWQVIFVVVCFTVIQYIDNHLMKKRYLGNFLKSSKI
ncbi:MAG: hypothetical protein ABIR18_06965 [Chitinophagaceae bacterium]